MIRLILGGAKSGKSSFAEQMAMSVGGKEVVYLATAEVKDEEMAQRVAAHREARPEEWKTIEEPLAVDQELKDLKKGQVVLLDCVTVFVSNLYYQKNEESQEEKEERIFQRIKQVIHVAGERGLNLVLVSNEVGLGIVPAYEDGRKYRDLAGKINQYLARKADEVFFMVAGLPVEIKEQGRENLDRFESNLRGFTAEDDKR